MIAGGHEEHAHFIQEEASEEVGPLEGHKEDAKSRDVDKDEGNRRDDLQPRPVGQGILKGRATDAMLIRSCAKIR